MDFLLTQGLFAVIASIIMVVVGKTFIKHLMDKPKAGNVIKQYQTPKKFTIYIPSVLVFIWVIVIGISIYQKEYTYMLLYIFWFVWTVEIYFKNRHGIKITENGILMYSAYITWDELTAITWEKNKRTINYYMKINYVKNVGIEKKYNRFFELSEENKIDFEKQIKPKLKKKNKK